MSEAPALDFPICADPRRDDMLRPLVGRVVRFLVDQVGTTELEAVILTGSAARGEASVLLSPHGFRLLGDLELLIIFRARCDWSSRRRMGELSRAATGKLGEAGRLATIEYGPADMGYLRRRIRPSIFAHDLFRHGKVVWGRADVLGEIPPFGVEAIPREDAVKLIMNRFIELLIDEQSDVDVFESEAGAYQLIKTIVDLSGSALAFAGRYVSRYAERPSAFAILLGPRPDLRAVLPAPDAFQEALDSATRCKLAPTVERLIRGHQGALRASVLAWVKSFWLWEMRQLLDLPSATFTELLDEYVWREPLRQRVRGWTKYYLHPLRPRGALAPIRAGRLFFRGGPSRLTYAAALLAQAAMAENRHDWKAGAADLLPVFPRPGNESVTRQAGELWRWLIRND